MELQFKFLGVSESSYKGNTYQKVTLFDEENMEKVVVVRKEKNKFDLSGIQAQSQVLVSFDVGIFNREFYLKVISLKAV